MKVNHNQRCALTRLWIRGECVLPQVTADALIRRRLARVADGKALVYTLTEEGVIWCREQGW